MRNPTKGLIPIPEWSPLDYVLVTMLTITGLILRIIWLNEGLWIDEILTLVKLVPLTAWEIVSQYDSLNNHVLYSLLAHYSISVFGDTAWALRLPAVLFGVATIPASYYLGRQLASRNEAFLATAFLVVSYHHVWFSQNARGYTGMLLGTVLLSILFIRLITQNKPGVRSVLAYAFIAALATWVHLTSAFVVIAHGMIWLLAIASRGGKKKRDLKPATGLAIVLSGVFTLALYFPVLTQLFSQFSVDAIVNPVLAQENAAADIGIWATSDWVLSELVVAMSRAIPGGWSAIIIGVLAMATGTISYIRQGVVAAGIVILPALVTLFFISTMVGTIFPRFLFSSASFFLLIAVRGGFSLSAAFLPILSARQVAIIGLIFVLSSASMLPAAWRPKQNYPAAAAYINEQRMPGDLVACGPLTFGGLHYYAGLECQSIYLAAELTELEQLQSRIWFLYAFSDLVKANHRPLWDKIQQDYIDVKTIRSTVENGDIIIMLRARPKPEGKTGHD